MAIELLRVLDNKFNHSMRTENENGETCIQLKYKFRTCPMVTYECAEMYQERIKSFLMYEWSKRKEEKENFKMQVGCLVVQNQYIHRFADVFLFDETETQLIEKTEKLFDILNHFYFPDVDVYFFVEDGGYRSEHRVHLIKDVLVMLQENLFKKYNFWSVIEEGVKEKEN